VGDLGDLGPVPQAAVRVEGGLPVQTGADRVPDWFSDRHPDREERPHTLLTQATDMAEEPFGRAGRVRPDQNVLTVTASIRNLRQRQVEYLDVVGGRVAARVPGAQEARQSFTRGVQETQQRMKAIGTLPCLRRGLLVRMTDHDSGVHIQHHTPDRMARHRRGHHPAGLDGLSPRDLTSPPPRRPQLLQRGPVQPVQHPPHRGLRRHRPEQLLVPTQHGEV
jgi:hypothetical protein